MEMLMMDWISRCYNSTEQFKGVNGVKCPIQRSQNNPFKGFKCPIITSCLLAALPLSAILERGNACGV